MFPYELQSLVKSVEKTAEQATKTLKAAENYIVSKTDRYNKPEDYRR